MDKDTILELAPHVLKRMEYSIEVFYLLNFENDEIWTGNYTSYLLINKLNGISSIYEIVDTIIKEYDDFTFDDLYGATIPIFQELLDKNFLVIKK